jgi:hypothetical protein
VTALERDAFKSNPRGRHREQSETIQTVRLRLRLSLDRFALLAMTVEVASTQRRLASATLPAASLAGSRLLYRHIFDETGGHIGPPPSSRCAAPSPRYGRFAMTAALQCGVLFP